MKLFTRILSCILSLVMLCSTVPVVSIQTWATSLQETAPEEVIKLPTETVQLFSTQYASGEDFSFSELSGKIVDASGIGLGDVSVVIYNLDESVWLTNLTTDSTGNWKTIAYDAISGYRYIVSYYKAGYQFSSNDIECVAAGSGSILPTVTATVLPNGSLESEYTFTTDNANQTTTITGYTGTATQIVLPSVLGGYPVTAIGSSAFKNNKTLTSIALGTYVQSIDSSAFNGCTALTQVHFSNRLKTIGWYAFDNCDGLTQVQLPNSVENIYGYAFASCTNLESINIPTSWKNASSYIFYNCPKLKSITVPEGVTKLPNYAFDNCTYLEEVILPSTLTVIGERALQSTAITQIDLPEGLKTIDSYAFCNCEGLTQVQLPNSVEEIGYQAFANCSNLESINIPTSWKNASSYIFYNCPKLTSITVPEGITKLPNNAFSYCSYLEEVILPSTLTVIGESALQSTAITQIDLPEGLKTINSYAFCNCEGLTSVQLPDSVENIYHQAFANCSNLESINIPTSWKNASSYIFRNCPKLTSITVPEGITALPEYAFHGANCLRIVTLPSTLTTIGNSTFSGCSDLRFVVVPESVTKINQYAFSSCAELRYVLVPNPSCTIGNNAFNSNPKMILYCEAYSLAAIHAIEYDIEYYATDNNMTLPDGILDRGQSYYFADSNALSTNGYITFTANYSVKDSQWNSISNKNLVIKHPAGMELVESSLRIGEELCTNYTYNESARKITIPATEKTGTIKYSCKALSDQDVQSYIVFEYRKNNSTSQEVIGIANETVNLFALYGPQLTSEKQVTLSGAAPAEATIDLYVNGAPVTTVTASKAGAYTAVITLNPSSTEEIFTCKATCTIEGSDALTAFHNIAYKESAPELTSFQFYLNGDYVRPVDLYSNGKQGIRPAITFTKSTSPYRFEIGFKNATGIDSLYVTSTRGNVKKSIPAVYDAESGKFVAEGFFDGNNYSYVPGSIGLEYNLKRKTVQVGEDVDWDLWKSYLDDDLVEGAVVENTTSETGMSGTVDFSGVAESLNGVGLKYSIGLLDEVLDNKKTFSDIKSNANLAKNIFGYVIPGLDDSRYQAYLDMSDPENVFLILEDATEATDKLVGIHISMMEYADGIAPVGLYDAASMLTSFSTGLSIASDMYGIHKDTEKLKDEILQSSTIQDKSAALKKADELGSDRMAFALITTLLPLLVGTGPMAVPTLMFTALLGSMVAMSDVFWQLRVNQIKGESYKINWHIDPSGYVYDMETNERIPGVTTTAYWIGYDESEDFWENKPADTEYGTVWNSLEYNQANPLITDAQGRYAWDVPEGWWRVKYEHPDYETTWSEWLPVPPPQTEVNIGMKLAPKNGWISQNGAWYYYVNNVMQTGWLQQGSTWYYMNTSGAMVTGWLQQGSTWYYMNTSGAMVTGWLQQGSTWYYLNTSGAMVTGTQTIDGQKHQFNSSGVWLGEVKLSGWVSESGKWYYYQNGSKTTGWKQIGSIWYYFASSGVMQTGWQQIGGTWYYFQSGGAMHTGWLQQGSTWYYLNASGAMVTGTQTIDGQKHQFNSSGVWLGEVKLSGWVSESGKWYYYQNGSKTTGWKQIGSTWYYFASSGVMQTGWQKIGGTWYYFQSGGAMQTGWLYQGGVWYYFHSSGAMATGSVKIGTKTYNFNSSGACLNP